MAHNYKTGQIVYPPSSSGGGPYIFIKQNKKLTKIIEILSMFPIIGVRRRMQFNGIYNCMRTVDIWNVHMFFSKLHVSESIILVSFMASLLCMLPLFLNLQFLDTGNLENVLTSSLYETVSLLTMGASLPCIFDLTLDAIYSEMRRKVLVSRLSILFALLGPTIIVYSRRSAENGPEVYGCAFQASQILFVCAMISHFVVEGASRTLKIWSFRVVCILCMQASLMTWQPLVDSHSVSVLLRVIKSIYYGEIVIANATVFYVGLFTRHKRESAYAQYSLLCATCLCAALLLKVIIGSAFARTRFVDTSVYESAACLAIDSVAMLITCTIPGRVARIDATVSKVSRKHIVFPSL
jgi:hypothetical protein